MYMSEGGDEGGFLYKGHRVLSKTTLRDIIP